MSKDAAKAPWEIAIEKLTAAVAESIAKAAEEADKRAKEAKAEAKARAEKAAAEAKAEADKRAKEAKAEADKRAAEAKAEADKRAAEYAARDARVDKEMAELRSLMSVYTTDDSEMLERDVAAAIIGAMSLGGIRFNEVITNSHVHGEYGNGEFDWIGINGETVIVGETRRTLRRGDARRFFADRLELFKRAFPDRVKGKEVRGAMICQKAKAGAVEEALKMKMMVFCAEGDKTLRPVKTPADISKRTQTKTHKRAQKGAA